MSAQCCYLDAGDPGRGCAVPATWSVVTVEAPLDVREACTAHVGALLVPGRINYVRALLPEVAGLWRCGECGCEVPSSGVRGGRADGICICADCFAEMI